MEPTTGVEPVNLFLTKEELYQLSYVGFLWLKLKAPYAGQTNRAKDLERETRLELATFSLEG